MTETKLNLIRRKFMMVSSAAIASPLLMNAASSLSANKTAEAKTTVNTIGDLILIKLLMPIR